MKKYAGGRGIGVTGKLVLSFMALIAVSIGLISIVSVRTSQEILLSQVSQNNLEAISQVKSSVEFLLDNMAERVNTLRADQAFMTRFRKYTDMTQAEYGEGMITSSVVLNDTYFLREKLVTAASSATLEGYYMFAVTMEGVAYASWGVCEQDLTEFIEDCNFLFENNPNRLVWLTTHRTVADSMYYPDDTRTFSVVKRVSYFTETEPQGYIVLSIGERNLYKTYDDLLRKKSGSSLYIIDKQGNQVSGMLENQDDPGLYHQVYENLSTHSSESKNGYFLDQVDGKRYLITYNTVAHNGWQLVYMTPWEQMLTPVQSLKKTVFLVLALAFLIASVFSFLILRAFSSRLSRLRDVMLRQGENGPMSHAQIYANDEIGDLADCYNHMADRINDYSTRLVEEQRKKREMELSFLQMEINSHFLYNTLNSVKILARLNMVDEIGGMITSLIKLLRLTSSKNDLITLEEELENAKHYVYIQKMRYLDRFEVEYDYGSWVADYLIPKLLIQPVIENAIFHGIADLERKGIIRIQASKETDSICIRISDNGKGIPDGQLEDILSHRQGMIRSVGLRNIDERIKLYYGDAYGIQVESRENEGTTVTVRIGLLPEKGKS